MSYECSHVTCLQAIRDMSTQSVNLILCASEIMGVSKIANASGNACEWKRVGVKVRVSGNVCECEFM